jgi:hypothetical protein
MHFKERVPLVKLRLRYFKISNWEVYTISKLKGWSNSLFCYNLSKTRSSGSMRVYNIVGPGGASGWAICHFLFGLLCVCLHPGGARRSVGLGYLSPSVPSLSVCAMRNALFGISKLRPVSDAPWAQSDPEVSRRKCEKDSKNWNATDGWSFQNLSENWLKNWPFKDDKAPQNENFWLAKKKSDFMVMWLV